jgi:cytochrome c oxidase subunit 4
MDMMDSAERAAHPKPAFYWKIWAWLLALTVLEVTASLKLTLPKGEMIVLLVGMAIIKALLVALYFMHLRFERVSLGITISVTLALALVLVFAIMMQWLFHSPSTVMPPR